MKRRSPNTAHSAIPVPCILIDTDYSTIEEGEMADVAPTILELLSVNLPKEITGDIAI
jgi:2,3-bisphosphoglycerate-independent phosphoglycerate mutase